MAEEEKPAPTREKTPRFHTADLQHYIKKYRLTRPISEVEARLLAEQAGLNVQQTRVPTSPLTPVVWHHAWLRFFALALLTAAVLLLHFQAL